MSENGDAVAGAVMHLKKKGALRPLVFGFVIGICLLIAGGYFYSERGEEKSGDRAEQSGDASSSYTAFLQYKEDLRLEIEGICLQVAGVKSAYAVVFFDGVGESVYATNTQAGNTDKSEYVIVGSGSSAHALYLGESLPALSGIGVTCDTGGRVGVRSEVAALLSAAYGLPMTRVYVSEGK